MVLKVEVGLKKLRERGNRRLTRIGSFVMNGCDSRRGIDWRIVLPIDSQFLKNFMIVSEIINTPLQLLEFAEYVSFRSIM